MMGQRHTVGKVILAALYAICMSGCGLFGPKVYTETYETDSGAIVVEAMELVAIVEAIDEAAGTVTLDTAYSGREVVKVGEGAAKLDQIRVGDELHVVLIEEIVVNILPGGAPESIGELDAVALAPNGEKPAVGVVSSREVTADVVAIDAHSHSITLEFVDGSTGSYKVGKHIDLSRVGLGDSVRIIVTDAVAIEFRKPPQ